MGTRCQIKLKSDDETFDKDTRSIHIYKHWDGYPEGVLPILKPFVKAFHESRGCNDGVYLLCQIVREFARKDGDSGCTGWGLDCVQYDDIEYLYEVDSEGRIFVNGKLSK